MDHFIPLCQLERLQSVINTSAQMVFSSWRFDHITPLLHQLHWLKVPEQIDYKLALLVYKCLQGVATSYLADDLCRTADVEARHCLHSALSPSLIVRRMRLSTYGVASLEQCHITSRLHSHCLFFTVVWRLISSVAAFVDYIVVLAKWHSSLRTR